MKWGLPTFDLPKNKAKMLLEKFDPSYAYCRAEVLLIQEGNKISGELGQIFKDVGKRMVDYGKSINS